MNDVFLKKIDFRNCFNVSSSNTLYNDSIKSLDMYDYILYTLSNTNKINISPFFVIAIYRIYEYIYNEDNKYIIIDLNNLNSYDQHIVLHFFTQYIDYNIIKLYTKKFNSSETIDKNHKIHLYYQTDKKHNFIVFNDKEYKYLPTIKITRLTGKNINKDYNDFNDETLVRKNFYIANQLEKPNLTRYIKKDIFGENIEEKKVWDDLFNKYLNIDLQNNNLLNTLKIILKEAKQNIQKHTKNSNGYISFYKNTQEKLNEFIICDDFKKGFINRYKEVLITEKNEIIELHKKRSDKKAEIEDILDNYNEDITNIDNGKEIEVLKKLFDMKKTYGVHQAGRILMHFGIPSMLKLINELNKNNQNKSKLNIYLHHKNKYFHIEFKGEKDCIIEKTNEKVTGTYIHLSFPFDIQLKQNNEEKISYIQDNSINYENGNKFRYMDLTKLENCQNDYLFIRYEEQDISDFLRNLFSNIYKNNLNNIIVYNFPIKRYRYYLLTLIDIIFLNKIPNDKTNKLNLLILNKFLPKAFYIGGETKEELYEKNYFLQNHFNYNKSSIINLDKDSITEKDFFKNEYFFKGKYFFKPEITLKNNNEKFLYTEMLENFLKLNSEEVHVDTKKDGLHIKRFYYTKRIFEDYIWNKYFAEELSLSEKIDKNTIFIGIGKYSAGILSVSKKLLNNKERHFLIEDITELDKIIEENNLQQNKDKIICFKPTVLNSLTKSKYIDKNNFYCAIKFVYDNQTKNDWKGFIEKDITNDILNLKGNSCEYCKENKAPLYIMNSNGYDIDEYLTLKEKSNPKKNNSSKTAFEVDWHNAIHNSHVKRGNNHYFYYIKTIAFLNTNREDIKFFLDTKSNERDENRIAVLFAPVHETNNEFVSMVKQYYFKEKAYIHYFDNINKEEVLFSLDYITERYDQEIVDYYFVDDEISSGVTLENFFLILKEVSNKKKFKAVFTLIDRLYPEEEEEIFSKYFEKMNSYVKLNIKPIKTNLESCYLCKRKKYFDEVFKKSSLVYLKRQFELKRDKIVVKNSREIEFEKSNIVDDEKNIIKMLAVEFVYKKIEEGYFQNNNINFHNIINNFTSEIINYFSKDKQHYEIVYKFESKIAIIKSFSFPKLSFFKQIKELVFHFLINEITKVVKEINKIVKEANNSEDIFYNKIKMFSSEDLNSINEEYKKYYSKKTKIDYFNFLILTASYMKINRVLDKDILEMYYTIGKYIKKTESNLEDSLLHKYPVAIKMATSNKSTSSYFNDEYQSFRKKYPTIYDTKNSLLFSLLIENNEYKKQKINYFEGVSKINEFKNKLKEIIIDSYYNFSDEDISEINFYCSIDGAELIDIFNDYEVLNNTKNKDLINDIDKLYKGAVRDKSNEDNIVLKEADHNEHDEKYNVWSNYYYSENHNSKDTTFVRITDNYTPIGVLSFKHSSGFYKHINIARVILMIQSDIYECIKNNQFLSVKNYLSKIESNTLKIIASNISHSDKSIYEKAKKHITSVNIETLYNYTMSTEYGTLEKFVIKGHIGPFKDTGNLKGFFENLKKYFDARNTFYNKNIDMQFKICENIFFYDINLFKSMIFEFARNAYKNAISKDAIVNFCIYKQNEYCLYIVNDKTKEANSNIFKSDTTTGTSSGNGLYVIKEKLKADYNISIESIKSTKAHKNLGCCEIVNPTFIIKLEILDKSGGKKF